MRIKIDNTRCTGCLLCEITCSLIHGGQIQRDASAIRVKLRHLDYELHQPVVCRQCRTMPCLKAEPGAEIEDQRKAFLWQMSEQRQKDCAFGALFVHGQNLVHCNLCGGSPECIKSCPTGALSLAA